MRLSRLTTPAFLVLLAAGHATPALFGPPPDPMAAAARAFLSALDDEQRVQCRHAFDDAQRGNWQMAPFGDAGVRLDGLDDAQREVARALIASVLSEHGVATVDGVRLLEGILVELEARAGRSTPMHGAGRYFFTVYGDPGGATPWGWRVEGHHLSLSFTSVDGEWLAHGPFFIGSQPARVRGGEHDGFRLLGDEDDLARALYASLDEEQRGRATVAGALPGNVLLEPGKDEGFAEPAGLPGADMTSEQRAQLSALVEAWVALLRPDLAEAELKRVRTAGLDEVRLVWMGGTGPDAPHYWRVVGPHYAIELVAPQRDPAHVHAVWRDLERDLGGELLRRHPGQAGGH